jgi:hypothetical protein
VALIRVGGRGMGMHGRFWLLEGSPLLICSFIVFLGSSSFIQLAVVASRSSRRGATPSLDTTTQRFDGQRRRNIAAIKLSQCGTGRNNLIDTIKDIGTWFQLCTAELGL